MQLTVQLHEARERRSRDQSALTKRREMDRLKDEFISTVSHELRTPLTSIRGALGLLAAGAAGQVDAKAQNLLRIASTNTDRLVRLINDILDLQRMDSGQAPLHLRRCLLPDVVLQATETMLSMAEAAGVQLDVTQPASVSSLVFDGDPDRMQQVLCNLLSNAVKFSPPDTTVRIESSVEAGSLLLRVEDRGRGVPPDKLESIFDRFGQVELSDSRQKGGTGLGLAICRAIVAQHGGEIWAERNDRDGRAIPGLSVCVRLPRLAGAEERDANLPLGSVLVVDDDSVVREVVSGHLRGHGYSVLEATGGAEALEIAGRGGVEAILLDLYMPGMSGWETLERLRENPATAHVPVVVLSVLAPGTRNGEDRAELETALPATQGWVQKPFGEELLLAALGRVLHAGAGQGRILLVEDDADLAAVVVASFGSDASAGFGVQHVNSVSDAKTQCELQPPDLMILDLTLPDGDGFALVDWLRRHNDLRMMPLVVFSGRELSEEERAQLRLGPTQFLTKARVQPRDVEKLVMSLMHEVRQPAGEQESASLQGLS